MNLDILYFIIQIRAYRHIRRYLWCGQWMHRGLSANCLHCKAIIGRTKGPKSGLLQCRRQFSGHTVVQYRTMERDKPISEYAARRCYGNKKQYHIINKNHFFLHLIRHSAIMSSIMALRALCHFWRASIHLCW